MIPLKLVNSTRNREFIEMIRERVEALGKVEVSSLLFDFTENALTEVHPIELMADSLYHQQTGKRLLDETFSDADDYFGKLASKLNCRWHRKPESGNVVFTKLAQTKEKE